VEHRLDRALFAAEAGGGEEKVLDFLRDSAHGASLSQAATPVADADVSTRALIPVLSSPKLPST